MAELQTYPDGTPTTGDKVPYLADPAGTPALKLADVDAFGTGGGGGTSNPWELMAPPAGVTPSVDEEFDGTSGLTWTNVAPASGGGTVAWSQDRGLLSALYGGQADQTMTYRLTAHAIAVGETVETALSQSGATLNYNVAGLVITDGATSSSNVLAGLSLISVATPEQAFGSGTVAAVSAGSLLPTVHLGVKALRARITRVTSTTWRYQFSPDGVSWLRWPLTDVTWSNTPSHVGVAVSSWSGDTAGYGLMVASFEYLRVY